MPSSAVEDYLKALYQLGDEEELVPLGLVAEHLNLTPGTVTTMMKHLHAEKFVEYIPRRGAKLTKQGQIIALKVLRRHRLIESFLVDIMKIDWSHVHEEAEILEHALSDRLIERIDEMLGRPTTDPHGDPIPSPTGVIEKNSFVALSECPPGNYLLKRIRKDDPPFLRWLEEAKLKPGTNIQVLNRDDLAEIISIRHGKENISRDLSTTISSQLLVEQTL